MRVYKPHSSSTFRPGSGRLQIINNSLTSVSDRQFLQAGRGQGGRRKLPPESRVLRPREYHTSLQAALRDIVQFESTAVCLCNTSNDSETKTAMSL